MAKQVPPIGKWFRILRVYAEQNTQEMADTLGISDKYLYRVEAGKTRITDTLVSLLKEKYDLTEEQATELDALYQTAAQEAEIRRKNRWITLAPEDAKLVNLFSRRVATLAADDRLLIEEILKDA